MNPQSRATATTACAAVLAGLALVMLAGCTTNPPEPDAGRINLTIGHCAVEPVQFEGTTYEVVEPEQFGEGDMTSDRYTGSGTAKTVTDTWLIYRDNSGKKLTMRASDGETASSSDPHDWCR